MADKKIDPKETPSKKPSPAAAKPTSTPSASAPKSSGIMGSAASKQTSAPRATGIAGSAANKKPAAAPATKTTGIMGSAANKQTAPAAKPNASVKPASEVKPAPKAAPAAAKPAPAPAPKAAPAAAKPAPAPAPAPKAAPAATRPAPAPAPASAPVRQQANRTAAATANDSAKPRKAPKPAKAKNEKPARENRRERGGAVAATQNGKSRSIRLIAIGALALIVAIALIIGIVIGAKSCKGAKGGSTFSYEYANASAVGYSSEVLGTVKRVKPVAEIKNEGLAAYPKYGYTLSEVIGETAEKQAARAALIDESDWLTAYGTRNNSGNGSNGDGSYNMMDKDGYLYFVTADKDGTLNVKQAVNPDGSYRQLYKHSSAVGMYYGGINDANPDISDSEPAVIKEVFLRPRGYGSYSVTGLYAPAGEVIKIEISEEDMNATGGVTIHIGQALYNGQSNNIWVAKGQMQRFPNILNTMTINKNTATLENGVYTAYVGSFIGGPLYVRNTVANVTLKISGGLEYSHFILGSTTKAEFERTRKTTVPYFDLEVWNFGVLHSGPKFYSQKYSYDDLYNVAVLWEKVASVTTANSNQGIVFLYDPFVAAGAAVAFPGRSSVNCPAGWMDGSLSYEGIVSSGSWGNFHEYHHNFQGYGVGNGGEVTNNGMTLVSYSLFTKISSKRGIANYGAQGLGGWNNYTSPTLAIEETLKIARPNESPSNGNQGLALYATLLHNFGPDNYIQAKVAQQRGGYGQSYAGYFRAWEQITHNDMTYFFKDVLCGLNDSTAQQYHNAEYTSMFVPVASVYQTGRSYMYNGEKQYFKSAQPYVIPYGNDFTIDLSQYNAPAGQYASGSVVLPEGFTYKVKSVSQPEYGKITKVDDFHYTFTPDTSNKKNMFSGKIIATLEITKDDGTFKVDDVDLVLEFEQTRETNKMVLERTTYTLSGGTAYTDAAAAYDAGFAGYTGEKWDHTNPTQNCNTDIWLCTEGTIKNFPKADPVKHLAKANTIELLEGKLYFEEEGQYRIFLRGRKNCAVYYSVDEGKTYKLGAHITNGNGSGFYINDKNSYFDVELEKHSWVYVKEVMIVETLNASQASYIGLGYGKWTTPMYRSVEKYYDKDGNEVASAEAEGYHHSAIVYYDANDKVVSADVVTQAKPVPPTSASYINAYRCDYEFPDNNAFRTDYFYKRTYAYDYTDNRHLGVGEQTVVADQCANLNLHTGWGGDDLSVAVDGVTNQGGKMQLHTGGSVNANSPFTLTIDLGKIYKANRLVIFSQPGRSDPCFPKALNLYSSADGIDYSLVKSFTDLTFDSNRKDLPPEDRKNDRQTLDFDETEMRYYKIEVTQAMSDHLIIRELEMWHIFEINGGKHLTPDSEDFKFTGNWSAETTNATFGHAYVGSKGTKLSFEFTGTGIAILTASGSKANYNVYIDGKKVSSIDLKTDFSDSITYMCDAWRGNTHVSELKCTAPVTFLCNALKEGKHTVELRCTGKTSVDSIVIFP